MLSKYCVIGAGPSGLVVARHFLERRIPFDCLEQQDRLGGTWYADGPHSSVYSTTYLISSKRLTEFPDFPMPDDFPPYPHHRQVWQYLRQYAHHFRLDNHIQTSCRVISVEPATEGWRVMVAGEPRPRLYRGVVLAHGHHWDPNRPEITGENDFQGTIIHSRQYKAPSQLAGRRVLVIGAGNSGCDIAVDAAQHAEDTYWSLRRGYYFLPKFICGMPADRAGELLYRMRLPLRVRRWVARALLRITVGPLERYGMPTPQHRLFETHPIINSQALYFVGHGRIKPKGPVERLDSSRAVFKDGSYAHVDLVILATGYRLSFPWIDQKYLNMHDGHPRLFVHAFHPARDDLFVAGMVQPSGGQWPLTHDQARLIAAYIVAQRHGRPEAAWFQKRKQGPQPAIHGGVHYLHSPRHFLEVDPFAYRRQMAKLLHRFRRIEALTYE